MSWLSRVRSGIPFLPKRQTTENLWHKCPKCGTMVFAKEWEENYSVCPRCDFHDRIGPLPCDPNCTSHTMLPIATGPNSVTISAGNFPSLDTAPLLPAGSAISLVG